MGFFNACVQAGPNHCAIANFSGPSTTPRNLFAASSAVFEDLIQHPRYLKNATIIYAWNKYTPVSLYQDIKQQLFNSLYSPESWSYMSEVLLSVFSFDYSSYYQTLPLVSLNYNKGFQAFWGIACSDAAYRATNFEDMEWLVKLQQNVSDFSDLTSEIWPCYQWKMAAAERYTGNFSVKTRSPILFTNGLYDPVTPFSSAVNASSRFEGSALLTHGGYGVCELSRKLYAFSCCLRSFLPSTLAALLKLIFLVAYCH